MNEGRVALITGASSGIGRATAIAFLEAGYNVIVTARRADRLAETIAAAGATGERALSHRADVTDAAAVEALFDHAVQRFGRVDVVFNNAGISAPAVDIDQLPLEAWTAIVNTNLTGPFLCARQAFRVMKQQSPKGGRIINNGSISAHTPRPMSAPYSATKHAITGLTKACALDGRPHNIACGQIDIGNAASEMTSRMTTGARQADGRLIPEPVMDVANVVAAVLHMASLPLSANILTMTVMATNMPFVGRG
ncbi:SDR family oxidoreductase [Mesorhizobium sp. M0244]|uniref:SDR family oxidoreductase n=1 Tax=Mesorhizobium sp. M0244 TaxID=2956926 RepID=UPI00333A367B